MSKLHHPKNKAERRRIDRKKSLKRIGADHARREIPAKEDTSDQAEARDNLDPLVAAELRKYASDS